MSDLNHEKVLIEGLNEGNEKIFDYLFHLYYSGLVVYAGRMINSQSVAEDLVQDVFVKLWTNRRTLEINQSLKSYFFISVKNKCIDFIRHQKLVSKTEQELANQTETISNDHHFLIESELRAYLFSALEKLPEACREIFVQNRFEGLKPKEIAEKRGISVRTVETQIGKALKILRSELSAYLPVSLVAIILGKVAEG
jgi:RNA polymerase sigma-70 factor, ECF subfamily